MNKLKVGFVGFVLFLLVFNLAFVSAITGSIGNARMVLRAETGDTIEKSVLVKNVNDVSVRIDLSVSGDLAKDIKLDETTFELAPGKEKKAYFTIKVREEGMTESKIEVKFTPLNNGNGVGLSSTVIVIAEKGDGFFDFGGDEEPEETNSNFSFNNVNPIRKEQGLSFGFGKIGGVGIGLIITFVILAVFFVLLILYSKNKVKKEVKRNVK